MKGNASLFKWIATPYIKGYITENKKNIDNSFKKFFPWEPSTFTCRVIALSKGKPCLICIFYGFLWLCFF